MRAFTILFTSCVLCLVFGLNGVSPVHAADFLSLEEGLALARENLEAGRHAEAFRLYLDLLRGWPEDPTVNLELARAALKAGRINHALMAYERVLEFAPNNAGLRLEYAAALQAAGQNERAAEQLTEARRLDPDLAAGEFGKALAALERRGATLIGSARIAGGVIYDSNMTMAPSQSSVRLGGLDIILDPESRKKDAWGTYLHATGEGSWRSSPDSLWWLVGDVSGYQRWYFEKNPQRDLTFGRAAGGLRYARENMLAEFRLKAETLLENGEHSVSLYGGEGTAVYAVRPDWHVIFRGGLDHRDDHDIHDRSGLYAWSGIFGRWFFSEQGHSLLFGVKGYGADAHASRFNFVGVEPSVNLNLNLPWETELMLGLGWHVEQYNGPATVLGGSDRHDRQWRTSVFAVKKLSDNFQIEAGWQYRDNRSNSDLYQYDQHMFLLGWALVF